MRKNIILAVVFMLVICTVFTSCISMFISSLTPRDYTVKLTESPEQIHKKVDAMEKNKTYWHRFTAKDKAEKQHTVTLWDKQYMTIDGNLFAYKVDSAMYNSIAFRAGGQTYRFDGTEYLVGFHFYATLVDSSIGTTISFIWSKKIAGGEYSNKHEASNIPGIVFSSTQIASKGNGGYVDDFGQYHSYTYFDFFDDILGTKRDVSTKMYCAISMP